MRNNCGTIKPEIENSIDEQIIPAKLKYSGIRQYNPKKPVKWGFKNFCLFRIIRYNVWLLYLLWVKRTGSYVVSKLIKAFPQQKNYQLFFDNWFCSLALCLELRQMEFLTIVTIRSDRIKYFPYHEKKLCRKGGEELMHVEQISIQVCLFWGGMIISAEKCVQVILILHLV